MGAHQSDPIQNIRGHFTLGTDKELIFNQKVESGSGKCLQQIPVRQKSVHISPENSHSNNN